MICAAFEGFTRIEEGTMNNKRLNRFECRALLVLAMLPASGAMGAVVLGTDFGDGSFTDVNYGDPAATGLAYVTPILYAGGLIDSPTNIATTTLLSYGYSVSGLGSNRMEVTYSVTNDDTVDIASTFGELRFIVNVDPNGNLAADPAFGFNDTATVVWGAKTGGDPDNYQVAEFAFIGGLQDSIFANGGLNDTNTCPGGTCDVDFALQWNLTSLAPGEIWNITIGLADNGSRLSTRYLQAVSADGPATSLTFSGTASIVPIPPAVWLFGSGLIGLIGVARRKKT